MLLAVCYGGYALNAVDMIFIGASNQLGEFESGLTAPWLGAVPALVLGHCYGALGLDVSWNYGMQTSSHSYT